MRRERARRIGGVFTRGGNRGLARFRLLHPGPRRRTQGRLACPMVSRAPQRAPTLARPNIIPNSESCEVVLAHVPGLWVVIAYSPEHTYGLQLAAIRDPQLS